MRGEEVMGESRYDLTCPRPRCDFSRHRAHVMTFPDPRSCCDFSRSQAHVVFFSNPGRVVTFFEPRPCCDFSRPKGVGTRACYDFSESRCCELGNGVTCPTFPMNFATFMLTMPECLDGSLCYDIVVANFPSKVWWGAAMF